MAAISFMAPNFTLAEFEAVSDVPLSLQHQNHAVWHAERLQRLRDVMNSFYQPPPGGGDWRIHLTSFLRVHDLDSDHSTGAGLDWNVRDAAGTRYDDMTRWGRDWLALNDPDAFAVLIYEPGFTEGAYAHTHHARRGFSRNARQNETPQFLDEVQEGVYRVASILPFPKPTRAGLTLAAGLALIVGAYFVLRT